MPRDPAVTDPSPEQAFERLKSHIAGLGSVAVAFSAGVDSTVVLAVAHAALGRRAVGVFGTSPSVPAGDLQLARSLATLLGARLLERPTHELSDPAYAANAGDRCYHCKSELFDVCRRVAAELGLAAVLDGTQADDLSDVRPGRVAAGERGVRSPLAECGLTKHGVRQLARHLGLPNWDKPEAACLASRLPLGTPVTAQKLAAVDQVESALRSLGFEQVRARHHGATALLQVEPHRVADLAPLMQHPELLAALTEAGFERAEVDPTGYRRGAVGLTQGSPAP